MDGIEFTDRYKATGTPYPDPATMCNGQCEGMGCYPLYLDGSESDYEREQWNLKEATNPTPDGYHFIQCGECGGTGKRVGGPAPQESAQ